MGFVRVSAPALAAPPPPERAMEDAAAGSPAPSTPELVPDADGYRRIPLAAGVSLTEEQITQLRAFPQPPSDLAALQAHCDTFAADDAVLVVREQGEYDIELVALGRASVFATAQLVLVGRYS